MFSRGIPKFLCDGRNTLVFIGKKNNSSRHSGFCFFLLENYIDKGNPVFGLCKKLIIISDFHAFQILYSMGDKRPD